MKNAVLLIALLGSLIGGISYIGDPEADFPNCTDTLGCVRLAPEDPIRLGVIQDMSGRASSFGLDQIRSFQIALSERNNGLLNHRIELISEDSRCLPEYGVLAARKMVSDPKVVAILGTTCSNSATEVIKVVSEAGYTMMSGTNSATSLTTLYGAPGANWRPGFFRTMFGADQSGIAAAIFAYNHLGVRRVVVVHDGDAYTKGYAEIFVKRFQAMGGKVVLETQVNKGETNMNPVLEAVSEAKAELLFLPIFADEGLLFIKQMKQFSNLDKIQVLGGNALINTSFIEGVGDHGKGMYFLSIDPSKDSPRRSLLIRSFEEAFGEPPQSTLFDYGYDAINLLLHAIEQAAEIDSKGNIQIGRKKLRDTLYGIRSYPGITGVLSCRYFGDFGVPRFRVVQLNNPKGGVAGLKSNIIFRIDSVTPSKKRNEKL